MKKVKHTAAAPVEPPGLLQHFKHVLLKDVQPPVSAALHIPPDNVQVERWSLRGRWVHSGDLGQRVAVAAALLVLVAHHGHVQVPDQLSHQRSHGRRLQVLAPLLPLAGLQQHPVQHQGVPVDQRLGLVVDARVVEHEGKVVNQRLHVLVAAPRHVASHTLHVDGPLDGGVVVRQLSARRQAEEDGAQAPPAAVGEVAHGVIKLVQLLLQRCDVFGLLGRNTAFP